MKRIIYLIALVLGAATAPLAAYASDISVTPAVIDLKAHARDILSAEFTIENTGAKKLNLYPAVLNVNVVDGSQTFTEPVHADLAASLANWIEVSRGVVELYPGEKRKIPFQVNVNLTAKPGNYHAVISFSDGPNRDAAEAGKGAGSAAVNLEVSEVVRESISLTRFAPEKKFFLGTEASFVYTIQNAGNKGEAPAGEIFVYDRRGKEIGTLAVNAAGAVIPAEESKTFSSGFKAPGLGQYKAIINVAYGKNGNRLQDTIFFWVVPWPALIFGGGAFFFLMLGTLLFLSHRESGGETVRSAPGKGMVGKLGSEGIPHVVDLRHPHPPKP